MPARGVERWLSQRLSHVLGAGGNGDGVCAGVSFRSPASLIAEITGTVDDDPWSPDAMTWPLLETIDASLDQPWCAILAKHLGHFDIRRRGRVAQRPKVFGGATAGRTVRLLRPAASAAAHRLARRQHRQASTTICTGSPSCGAHSSSGSTPIPHTSANRRPSRGCRKDRATCRHGCRCSGTPGWRRTDIELLQALSTHHDLHLWLPHPSDALWQKLDRTPRRHPPSRGHQPPRGRPSAAGHARTRPPRAATQPAGRRATDEYLPNDEPPGDSARLAAVRHRRQCRSAARTYARGRRPLGAGAQLPRPGPPGRRAARGAARPAARRPDAGAARHPGDVPGHRDVCTADRRRLRARRRGARRASRLTGCGSSSPTVHWSRPIRCSPWPRSCWRWPTAG